VKLLISLSLPDLGMKPLNYIEKSEGFLLILKVPLGKVGTVFAGIIFVSQG
jgi:hypothetical protein